MVNKKNVIKIATICLVLMFFCSGISKISDIDMFINSINNILSQWIHLIKGDGYITRGAVTHRDRLMVKMPNYIRTFMSVIVYLAAIIIVLIELICPVIIVISMYDNKYINTAFICTNILAIFTIIVTLFAKFTVFFNNNIYSTVVKFYYGTIGIFSNIAVLGGLLLLLNR